MDELTPDDTEVVRHARRAHLLAEFARIQAALAALEPARVLLNAGRADVIAQLRQLEAGE